MTLAFRSGHAWCPAADRRIEYRLAATPDTRGGPAPAYGGGDGAKTNPKDKFSSHHTIKRFAVQPYTMDSRNNAFYTECAKYFESLRRKGETDNDFEDEFFYTVPAAAGTK